MVDQSLDRIWLGYSSNNQQPCKLPLYENEKSPFILNLYIRSNLLC